MDESMHCSCDHVEDNYIEMEVGSHSTIFSHSKCSPPHPREFEFQMFSSSSQRDTGTSPADELFYKGKLLPLHLPLRLEMVEKLLQNPNTYNCKPENYGQIDAFEEYFNTPLFTITNHTPTSNTPFQSCNISPSESCQVSRELNPEEYFFEYATEASSFSSEETSKRSWTRKLKLIKQSSLSSKLKASWAYLRYLFTISSCSSEASAAASRIIKKGYVPQANEDAKVAKKEPFGRIQRYGYQSSTLANSFKNENASSSERGHQRPFSGAFRTVSMTKSSYSLSSSSASSSASSSNNSNGFQELQFFKRRSSSYSEIENSIQAAIAHCRRSQQQFQTRKTATDLGFCSLSASRFICEEQERPGLCRG